MLNMCLMSIIMILCVLGIYFTVKEIASLWIKNKVPTKITVEINDNPDVTEASIRSIISANPSSDIFVIDKSNSEEIGTIISKLSQDNPQIHKIKQGVLR